MCRYFITTMEQCEETSGTFWMKVLLDNKIIIVTIVSSSPLTANLEGFGKPEISLFKRLFITCQTLEPTKGTQWPEDTQYYYREMPNNHIWIQNNHKEMKTIQRGTIKGWYRIIAKTQNKTQTYRDAKWLKVVQNSPKEAQRHIGTLWRDT